MQKKLIIGTAIGFWLLGFLINDKTPGWLVVAFGVIFFLTVASLVAFLIVRGTGWHALARKHPERTPPTGPLRKCRTFQMIALDCESQSGTRFSGNIVSVGSSPEALHVSMPAIVRFLFPSIELPWSAVVSAKPFAAPGWVQPTGEPGAVFQLAYDPGYRGEFIELETAAPRICMRLPLYALAEGHAHLPISDLRAKP